MLLSTSYDHALMALVIARAAELRRAGDKPIGRTALQKILFFLWMRGIPMGFKFRLFTYGPMCPDIFQTMEWLEIDEAVRDVDPDKPARSEYQPGPAATEVISQHGAALVPLHDKIDQILQECAPFDPEELELRATLTYINSQERASGRPGPYKAAVYERLRIVKKDKIAQGRFPDERIDQAYQFLIEKGWIAP